MYFPVGWPKHLDVPSVKSEAVQEVLASRDRSLFAVVTSQSLHIWQCKVSLNRLTTMVLHTTLVTVTLTVARSDLSWLGFVSWVQNQIPQFSLNFRVNSVG